MKNATNIRRLLWLGGGILVAVSFVILATRLGTPSVEKGSQTPAGFTPGSTPGSTRGPSPGEGEATGSLPNELDIPDFASTRSWEKMPAPVRQRWIQFEKFSPGNSYNPIPRNRTEKEKKARLDNIAEVQRLKTMARRGKDLTPAQAARYRAYQMKKTRDQIDLLRFTIQNDDSLTEDYRQSMTTKMDALREKLQRLRQQP